MNTLLMATRKSTRLADRVRQEFVDPGEDDLPDEDVNHSEAKPEPSTKLENDSSIEVVAESHDDVVNHVVNQEMDDAANDDEMSAEVSHVEENGVKEQGTEPVVLNIKKENVEEDTPASKTNLPLCRPNHKIVNGDVKRFRCSICGETLSSAKNLKRHINIHTRAEMYPCPVCNRSFIRKDYMVMHMKVHYGKKPHRCILCNKGFSNRTSMDAHKAACKLIDRTKDNHTCDTCGEVFSSMRNLKRHVNKHTLEDVYTCPVCSRPFLRQDYLQHHMRKKHEGQKYDPYQCSYCSKVFHSNIKLQEHIHSHTGKKSFTCTICKEIFPAILALKNHMRIHLQEKNTKDTSSRYCDICDVEFPGLFALNKHKLYQHNFCVTCDKIFPDREALETHKLIHEKEANPYVCDICQRSFTERAEYNSHICAASADVSEEILPTVSTSRSTSPDDLAKMSLAFWHNMNNESNVSSEIGSADDSPEINMVVEQTIVDDELPQVVQSTAESVSENKNLISPPKALNHPLLTSCLNSSPVVSPTTMIQPRANPRKSSTPKRSDVCIPEQLNDQVATSTIQLANQRIVNMSELSECSDCGIYFNDRTLYIMHMGLHVPEHPWQCNLCGEYCHDRYSFAVHVMKTQH